MKINRVGSCNYGGETHLPEPSPSLLLPRLLLRAAARQFRVIYLRRSFNHRAVTQAERKSFGGKEEVSVEEQREKKGGQKAGYVIKIEKEWERESTAAAVRDGEEERDGIGEKFKEARQRK